MTPRSTAPASIARWTCLAHRSGSASAAARRLGSRQIALTSARMSARRPGSSAHSRRVSVRRTWSKSSVWVVMLVDALARVFREAAAVIDTAVFFGMAFSCASTTRGCGSAIPGAGPRTPDDHVTLISALPPSSWSGVDGRRARRVHTAT